MKRFVHPTFIIIDRGNEDPVWRPFPWTPDQVRRAKKLPLDGTQTLYRKTTLRTKGPEVDAIYLQPRCHACDFGPRDFCEDDVWGECEGDRHGNYACCKCKSIRYDRVAGR